MIIRGEIVPSRRFAAGVSAGNALFVCTGAAGALKGGGDEGASSSSMNPSKSTSFAFVGFTCAAGFVVALREDEPNPVFNEPEREGVDVEDEGTSSSPALYSSNRLLPESSRNPPPDELPL